MASDRIQVLLEMDFKKTHPRWKKAHQPRTARVDLPDGSRESDLRPPRIQGELKMLGFDISERTVLRWMRKAPRNPGQAKGWVTFLSNLREAIAAMDSFLVPTLTFGVLYCFFVIAHSRRRILHCNVRRHRTTAWVAQQLREAFPYDTAPRYQVLDREHTFLARFWTQSRVSELSRSRRQFEVPGKME